jgi:preprotein translocase subunit SecE
MDKIKSYFEESYNELVHKVSWPKWEELQASATIVVIAMIVIALMVLIMDLFSKAAIVELIYNLF